MQFLLHHDLRYATFQRGLCDLPRGLSTAADNEHQHLQSKTDFGIQLEPRHHCWDQKYWGYRSKLACVQPLDDKAEQHEQYLVLLSCGDQHVDDIPEGFEPNANAQNEQAIRCRNQ